MKFKNLLKEAGDSIIPQDSKKIIQMKGIELANYHQFIWDLRDSLSQMFLMNSASFSMGPDNQKKTIYRKGIEKQFSAYKLEVFFKNVIYPNEQISLQMYTDSGSKTSWEFEYMELSFVDEENRVEFYYEFEAEFGTQFEKDAFNFSKIQKEFEIKTINSINDMINLDPTFIKWVKNPTKAQQELVLNKDPMLVKFIINLHPELIDKYQYVKAMNKAGILK